MTERGETGAGCGGAGGILYGLVGPSLAFYLNATGNN